MIEKPLSQLKTAEKGWKRLRMTENAFKWLKTAVHG